MATNIESQYVFDDNDSRVALTFLDLANKAFAVDDEVMIDKKTGRIYYKKPDGTIVPSTESIATTTLNILELSAASNNSAIKPTYPINKNSYMVMMSHVLGSSKSISTGSAALESFKFRINKEVNGFFLNIKTRKTDANAAETLLTLYNTKYPTGVVDDNAKVNINIKYVSSTAAELIITKDVDIRLNTIEFIDIKLASIITELTDVAYIEVTINDVISNLISEMIVDTSYTSLDIGKTITDIQIESFDVDAFMDTIEILPIDVNTTITNIYNAGLIVKGLNEMGSNIKEIIQIVTSVTDLPTGDEKPAITLLIEEVVMEEGDVI